MRFFTATGSSLQIGKESTFGTGVTPTALVDITSVDIGVSVEKGDEGSLLASKTTMARDLTAVNVDGSFDCVLRPESAGLTMALAMGGADTVTASSDKYKHSIVLANPKADLPSFTVVVDKQATIKKYAGCSVSSLTINAPAGDYVTSSISLQGVKEEAGTLATGLTSFTVPAYKCTSAQLTIDSTVMDVESTTLTIDNALEDAPKVYSTGLYKGQPQHGLRSVSVSISIPYSEDIETFKGTYLTADTKANLVLSFKSSDEDYTFTVKIPNLAITECSSSISGTGAIGASIAGEAISLGSTEPITVEIIDSTSTAYIA